MDIEPSHITHFDIPNLVDEQLLEIANDTRIGDTLRRQAAIKLGDRGYRYRVVSKGAGDFEYLFFSPNSVREAGTKTDGLTESQPIKAAKKSRGNL